MVEKMGTRVTLDKDMAFFMCPLVAQHAKVGGNVRGDCMHPTTAHFTITLCHWA